MTTINSPDGDSGLHGQQPHEFMLVPAFYKAGEGKFQHSGNGTVQPFKRTEIAMSSPLKGWKMPVPAFQKAGTSLFQLIKMPEIAISSILKPLDMAFYSLLEGWNLPFPAF